MVEALALDIAEALDVTELPLLDKFGVVCIGFSRCSLRSIDVIASTERS